MSLTGVPRYHSEALAVMESLHAWMLQNKPRIRRKDAWGFKFKFKTLFRFFDKQAKVTRYYSNIHTNIPRLRRHKQLGREHYHIRILVYLIITHTTGDCIVHYLNQYWTLYMSFCIIPQACSMVRIKFNFELRKTERISHIGLLWSEIYFNMAKQRE